jgi:outer membrane protein OmpA-like peptidoglycan-associated protein
VIVASETRGRERDLERPAFATTVGGRASRGELAAGADRDGDWIADAWDQCPLDPETYNGTEDEDGCPDRGSVLVTEAALVILDRVHFQDSSALVPDSSLPILDAVAATLRGNPQILRIDVEGHAAANEARSCEIAIERAGAVRAALIERGVEPERLTAVPFGATQVLDPRTVAAAHDANRRVAFRIQETTEGSVQSSTSGTTAGPLPPRTRESDGATEYRVGARVSIAARSSSIVTVLSQRSPDSPSCCTAPTPARREAISIRTAPRASRRRSTPR